MEIKLTITKILEPYQYTSKNGDMAFRYSAVGETQEQYPKTIKFDVFGQDRWQQMNFVVGAQYVVSIDINSREWQGKYFTNVTCYAAKPVIAMQQAQQMSQQPMMQQQQMYQQPMQQVAQPQQQYYQPQPAPQACDPNNVPF